MEVKIKIDEHEKNTSLLILTDNLTQEVESLKKDLEEFTDKTLNGYTENGVTVIREREILRVFSENKNVFCQTDNGVYKLHERLYEADSFLNEKHFVRISNSEIVNASKILKLDISASGTVGVLLHGNVKTYASRRYVKAIKEFFKV